ncbi:MAG: tRNA uridine-5-carboxymethylaminomethyl(34) synthesis GTPase MnmE [Treponema sp.]|jgi:tRNA modification GTPase|nr:tRNA uridine-5-carboxymethylaminomethyl(34) synthesis GTPase MnmE [Treponema sp.]
MDTPFYGDTAPIAAHATPLAESALAVIRTSGKDAIKKTAAVFSRPGALLETPGNTIVHGWIMFPAAEDRDGTGAGKKIDEVLVSVYRAPRSFTGEDGTDISCHGGIAAARGVMEALKAAGFRDALPGEFTFRAFMNGKLDLTRAESVMELVSAKTGRGRDRAVGRLSGTLEGEIQGIKNLLVRTLAETELFLDYSEEDLPAAGADPGGITAGEAEGRLPGRASVEEVRERLRALAASYKRERLYREGALVAIAGRPNAGKSSLFNLLLREDRSIVTDIPGTTRDWIEAWIALEGIPIRLADTAGLHASRDPVEKLGIARSRELLEGADLILYLIDGTGEITGEDRAFFRDFGNAIRDGAVKDGAVFDGCVRDDAVSNGMAKPLIVVRNKIDLAPTPPWGITSLGVSAKTGEGIPELTAAISAALEAAAGDGGELPGEGKTPAGLGTLRQKELVDRAAAAVEEALSLADRRAPLDLIAPLLREGADALGEITGEVSTAEILETMFSRFCVGK